MNTKIIDGNKIANLILEDILKEINFLSDKGVSLKLSAIQVGNDSASSLYVKQQKKICNKAGIEYELVILNNSITEAELLVQINKLNSDNSVTGIILQMPIFNGIDAKKIQASISMEKDVEGVNPLNMGWLVYGRPFLAPCTALAVIEILDSLNMDLCGKEVVVVGHSDIVGKPLSLLLLNKFATVSVCHIATSKAGKLEGHIRRADVLISAVGRPNLIPGNWVKEGAIVIDVGINKVGNKIVGDVEFDVAAKRSSFITPVPGGVGPVTISILLKNILKAAKWKVR